MDEKNIDVDGMKNEINKLGQDMENIQYSKTMEITPCIQTDNICNYITKNKSLINIDKENEVKLLQDQIKLYKEHIKKYCDIAKCSEESFEKLNEDYMKYKIETEEKLGEYEKEIQTLTHHCTDLETKLSLQENENVTNCNELVTVKQQLNNCTEMLETCQKERNSALHQLDQLFKTVQAKEQQYAREMVLQCVDMQTLTKIKAEISSLRNQINNLSIINESYLKTIEVENLVNRQNDIKTKAEKEDLLFQIDSLKNQNAILNEQIRALTTRPSNIFALPRSTDSNGTSDESNINESFNETECKSSDQLLEILEFIRKEKIGAMAKCDILQNNAFDMKSQIKTFKKQIIDTKRAIYVLRNNCEVNADSLIDYSHILMTHKTQASLSNILNSLEYERDSIFTRLDRLTALSIDVERQISPIKAELGQLSSKYMSLIIELTTLSTECKLWKSKINVLAQNSYKTPVALRTSNMPNKRPVKRSRRSTCHGPQSKQTRMSSHRELNGENQIPTSSQCNQDDENIAIYNYLRRRYSATPYGVSFSFKSNNIPNFIGN